MTRRTQRRGWWTAGLAITLAALVGCASDPNWVDDGVLASTEAPPSTAPAGPSAGPTASTNPAGAGAVGAAAGQAAPSPAAASTKPTRASVTATTSAPAATGAATAVAAPAPASRPPLSGSEPQAASPQREQAAPDRPAASAETPAKPSSGPTRWLPAEGQYVYDLSGTTSTGRLPASSALVISSSGPNRQRWSIDARDQKGEGWQESFGVHESSDGLQLSTYRLEYFSVARVTIEFELSPAAVFVPRPMTVGRKWAFDAVTKDGCYRVHSEGVVAAADKAVSAGAFTYQADVLETKNTLTTVGPPSCQRLDLNQTRRTAFDRATRLVVRDETHSTGTFAGFPFQSDVTALIRSTQPA